MYHPTQMPAVRRSLRAFDHDPEGVDLREFGNYVVGGDPEAVFRGYLEG
jgi:hypothetical protein